MVEILFQDLEFEESTANLVDDDHGFDMFCQGLAEDSLGLHADTLNTVNNNESTICDSENSCDSRREVDVSRGVNQVDQELASYNKSQYEEQSEHQRKYVHMVFCLMTLTSSLSISKYIEMAVDLMVIPHSFSSLRVSIKCTIPAFA